MAWQQLVDTGLSTGGPGWAQYADVATADAWIARAVDLTSDARETYLDKRPYPEQWTAVALAWTALSNVYRAANVRPISDPLFRAWWKRWNGCAPAAIFETCPRGVEGQGKIPSRLRAWWLALGKDSSNGFEKIVPRLALDFDTGELHVKCAYWPHGDDDCNFDGWSNGCTSNPTGEDGCREYTWHSWAWHDPPNFGFFASDTHQTVRALPPAHYFWEAAQDLAGVLTRRGASMLLQDAHVFVPLSNLKLAVKLGYELPADLQRAAAMLPADLSALSEGGSQTRSLLTAGIAVAGAAATALSGPFAPIVGAIVGVVEVIVQVMPFASGAPFDGFGRLLPAWDVVPIWTQTELPPTYTVDPPGPIAPVSQASASSSIASLLPPQLLPGVSVTVGQPQPPSQSPPSGTVGPLPLVLTGFGGMGPQPGPRKLFIDVAPLIIGPPINRQIDGPPTVPPLSPSPFAPAPINVTTTPVLAAAGPLATPPAPGESWYRSPVVVVGAVGVAVALGAFAFKQFGARAAAQAVASRAREHAPRR